MISPGTDTCNNIWWVTKAWRLDKKVTATNNQKVSGLGRQTQPAGKIVAGEMNELLSPFVISAKDVPFSKTDNSEKLEDGDSIMLYDLQ